MAKNSQLHEQNGYLENTKHVPKPLTIYIQSLQKEYISDGTNSQKISNLSKQLTNVPEKKWITISSYMLSIKNQPQNCNDLDLRYGLQVDLEIYDFDENLDQNVQENITIPYDIDIIKLVDCKAAKKLLVLYKNNETIKGSSEVLNIIEGPAL